MPAVYVSPSTLACGRPAFDQPADVPVVVALDVGPDGTPAFSTTAARFTYYDVNATEFVTLSHYTPRYGPARGGTTLYLSGTNFAPHPHLHCVVGEQRAPATFDSATLLRCSTPPMHAADGSADVTVTRTRARARARARTRARARARARTRARTFTLSG